jgi:uncharacterized membrane protein
MWSKKSIASSRIRRPAPFDLALVGVGIVYPAVVFFLRDATSPLWFVLAALAIVGLRLVLGNTGEYWRPALVATGIVLVALAAVDAAFAARAYPVLLSLAFSGVFAITLWHPPSLVERLALASGQQWSAKLQRYCRKVTVVWTLWLAANAFIAAIFALRGDDQAWALWTGAVSYAVSGLLFAGEWTVRQKAMRHAS